MEGKWRNPGEKSTYRDFIMKSRGEGESQKQRKMCRMTRYMSE